MEAEDDGSGTGSKETAISRVSSPPIKPTAGIRFCQIFAGQIVAEPITLPKPRPIKNPPIYANDRPFTIGRRPDPKWIARETCGGYPEYTKFVGSKVRRWPAQRRAEVVSTALDPPPVDRPRVEWDGPRYELISKIRETPREVYTTGWRTARERERQENSCFPYTA